MKKLFAAIIALLCLLTMNNGYAAKQVMVLDVAQAIGPATQDFILRHLTKAQTQKFELVVLRLDTPGGLGISMREINKAILASTVPVVTYVAPSGARAASAGTFILYASHLAAMAPGTNLGAAAPISIGGFPGEKENQNNQQMIQKKSANDATAYIRGLAQLRQRNVEWAEKAVVEAVSLPAEDALKLKVIDVVADSVPDLLQKLNGHPVQINKVTQHLQTHDAKVETIKPDWRYDFLSIITDPSIAYLLLLLGFYGLFFELANPGFVLPGVVGTISLLIALYAFQLLPISYVGLSLLLIGIGLMIAEIFVASFGILGAGGLIAFFAGSIMLFDTNVPGYGIAWSLIITMTIVSIGFIFLVAAYTVGSLRKRVVTGTEGLMNSVGEVFECKDHHFIINIQGEMWKAESVASLHPGQKVRVKKISNLVLTVEPIRPEGDKL